MKSKNGFTILETAIVAVLISALLALFFIQQSNLNAMHRDEIRKTALNAMHYALEEDFYAKNHYYPESISTAILPAVDPSLWTDPSGADFNSPASSCSYQPANCQNGHCSSYTLRAILEREDIYEKTINNK